MAILAMALSSRAISTGAARLVPRRTESQQPRRGDLLVVAGKKKSKRKEERKAAKRAETKALMSKHNAADEEDDTDDAPAAPSGPKPYEGTDTVMQSLTICGSYKEKTGEKLLEGTLMVQEASEALFKASFVCASHDAEDVFNYGNQAALSLWGLSWNDFVGMPSTKSAEEDDSIQSERRELLDKAAENGVIRDYSGVRQASDGRKFRVDGATVWTITDREGNKTGQAVRFDSFTWLGENGEEDKPMTVGEGGELIPAKEAVAEAADVPSPEELAAAKNAVDEQAAEVRRLKDDEGMSNSDPEVQEAVSELLARKSALAVLEEEVSA